MNKLWAFGCSLTFGHGLSDCFDGPKTNGAGPLPSIYSWPAVLANMLGREVVNLARPGGGNKAMLHPLRIVKDQIRKGDVIAMHWSYMERHMIVHQGGHQDIDKCKHFGPWEGDRVSKLYYRHFWNKQDDPIMTSWYIDYADLLLKNLGMKVIHCTPPNSGKSADLQLIQIEDYVKTHEPISNHVIDKALDGNHPGPVSHSNFARMINEKYGDYLK